MNVTKKLDLSMALVFFARFKRGEKPKKIKGGYVKVGQNTQPWNRAWAEFCNQAVVETVPFLTPYAIWERMTPEAKARAETIVVEYDGEVSSSSTMAEVVDLFFSTHEKEVTAAA